MIQLTGVINWEPSEAPGTMETTSPKLDSHQQAMARILFLGICTCYS